MDRHGIGEQLRIREVFRAFCEKNDWAIMSFYDGVKQELILLPMRNPPWQPLIII